MLSSIHPLGERARHNKWGITAGSFAVGAAAAGTLIGAALGLAGSFIVGGRATASIAIIGTAALVAGVLDAAGVAAPGPHRQVNERWIGTYRGSIYGAGFGVQLGAGVATYIVTWGVWATFVAEAASGSLRSGALIGLAFGLGRSVPILAGRWIDRPSRLTSFSAMMRRTAAPAFKLLAVATAMTGIAGIVSRLV